MKPEYDVASMKGGVRGKYAERILHPSVKTRRFFRYLTRGMIRGIIVAGAISALAWSFAWLAYLVDPCKPEQYECINGYGLLAYFTSIAVGMFVFPTIVVGTMICGYRRDIRS